MASQVYPGVGWVVWRSPEYLPQELVFNINYLGADQASFTLNFSKGASQIIGQYYQMIRLGKRGYRAIMANLTRTADYLAAQLQDLGFIIMSQGRGQACRLSPFASAPIRADCLMSSQSHISFVSVVGWFLPIRWLRTVMS